MKASAQNKANVLAALHRRAWQLEHVKTLKEIAAEFGVALGTVTSWDLMRRRPTYFADYHQVSKARKGGHVDREA